jgi:hypothetical protein
MGRKSGIKRKNGILSCLHAPFVPRSQYFQPEFIIIDNNHVSFPTRLLSERCNMRFKVVVALKATWAIA